MLGHFKSLVMKDPSEPRIQVGSNEFGPSKHEPLGETSKCPHKPFTENNHRASISQSVTIAENHLIVIIFTETRALHIKAKKYI